MSRRARASCVRTAGRGKRQRLLHLALSAWTEMVYAAQQADLDKEERQRRARLEEAMSVHAERDDLHDMCDNLRAELEDERARMRAQMEDAEIAALHALQERQTAQMKHACQARNQRRRRRSANGERRSQRCERRTGWGPLQLALSVSAALLRELNSAGSGGPRGCGFRRANADDGMKRASASRGASGRSSRGARPSSAQGGGVAIFMEDLCDERAAQAACRRCQL